MKRKKICLVTPSYPPRDWGGLARTVVRVAAYAREMGLECQVAELGIQDQGLVLLDENRTTDIHEGIRVHRITAGRERFAGQDRTIWDCPHTYTLRMMYQSLAALLQEEGFDLLTAFFAYPMGYLTAMLARLNRIPSVVMLLGNDIKKYTFSPEKVAMVRAGLEQADCVTSLAQDLIEMAHCLTPIKDKARTIHGSYRIPERSWSPRERKGEPFRFGFAGSFKYAKGLPYLFKALGALKGRYPVELELAGEIRASERPVFEEVRDRTGTGEVIRFKGSIPHQEIDDWLLELDGFVLPSVSEGCPNILMEAMACGLPCVSTRVGATPQMIEEGRSGLLVPAGDSSALAGAMAELMDLPDQGLGLGRAARQRIREEFSADKERAAWEGVFRGLISF